MQNARVERVAAVEWETNPPRLDGWKAEVGTQTEALYFLRNISLKLLESGYVIVPISLGTLFSA